MYNRLWDPKEQKQLHVEMIGSILRLGHCKEIKCSQTIVKQNGCYRLLYYCPLYAICFTTFRRKFKEQGHDEYKPSNELIQLALNWAKENKLNPSDLFEYLF